MAFFEHNEPHNLSEDPFYQYAIFFHENVNGPTMAYILPVGIFLNIINNTAVLYVLIRSKSVAKQITPTLKLYYILIAVTDMIISIPLHFTTFSGIYSVIF